MKLYLIRHGQSEANRKGVHAGWAQVPLTEQGRKEALAAGRLLKGLTFDKVYTTDLLRAIQTGELAMPGVAKEQTPLLREISVGALAGKNSAACTAEYGERYITQKAEQDFTAFGGENYEMMARRVGQFMEMAASGGYTCVAAFCHEGAVRTALDLVLGLRVNRKAMCCDNGSMAVFECIDGRWRLCQWNMTAPVPLEGNND